MTILVIYQTPTKDSLRYPRKKKEMNMNVNAKNYSKILIKKKKEENKEEASGKEKNMLSAPKSGSSTSRVKSKLSSKRLNYVLGGLSMSSTATTATTTTTTPLKNVVYDVGDATTTHHNVSDAVGVAHPCSSYSAKVSNAKQVTIKAFNKNQYPNFIRHHCMKLLLLLCQPFGFRSSSQKEQASYKSCMKPQLYYFDCYDTENDIIFVNSSENLPDTFNNYFNYYDPCYTEYYNQYRKTCTDKLTSFNLPTSLQEAFDANTNAAVVVFDLDNAPSDVSVSD